MNLLKNSKRNSAIQSLKNIVSETKNTADNSRLDIAEERIRKLEGRLTENFQMEALREWTTQKGAYDTYKIQGKV